ncbi:MAG: hypothetical protein IEMM0002_1035 [bacterium]|nr:MAG: hypothetical protein IEMM0002_1035 [bacterium]
MYGARSLMHLELSYGDGTVEAEIPASWIVEEITAPERGPIPSPEKRLSELLDKPVGGSGFDEIFNRKKSVAIVVPDVTRNAGADRLLPPLLIRLEKLGVNKERVTIIFATGIHPPQTEKQKNELLGDAVYRNYKNVDHDSRGETKIINLADGSSVEINRVAAQADGLIVIGSVKLHYLAGFGGGRKAILPGIASYDSCMEFHKLCLNTGGVGKYPSIGPGLLDGNPMHQRAVQAARAAGVDFLINTVLDKSGNFLFLNGGGLEESFKDACRFVSGYSIVPINRLADVVIASTGGYPSDINFIQSHKSLDFAYRAVKRGGVIVLLAECSKGIGNERFLKWFEHGSSDEMEKTLINDFAIYGQTARATRKKTEDCEVLLISDLPDGWVRKMGMTKASDLSDAVGRCQKRFADKSPLVHVMKKAGSIMPWFERSAS